MKELTWYGAPPIFGKIRFVHGAIPVNRGIPLLRSNNCVLRGLQDLMKYLEGRVLKLF